jgi:hypothetical protein
MCFRARGAASRFIEALLSKDRCNRPSSTHRLRLQLRMTSSVAIAVRRGLSSVNWTRHIPGVLNLPTYSFGTVSESPETVKPSTFLYCLRSRHSGAKTRPLTESRASRLRVGTSVWFGLGYHPCPCRLFNIQYVYDPDHPIMRSRLTTCASPLPPLVNKPVFSSYVYNGSPS